MDMSSYLNGFAVLTGSMNVRKRNRWTDVIDLFLSQPQTATVRNLLYNLPGSSRPVDVTM